MGPCVLGVKSAYGCYVEGKFNLKGMAACFGVQAGSFLPSFLKEGAGFLKEGSFLPSFLD